MDGRRQVVRGPRLKRRTRNTTRPGPIPPALVAMPRRRRSFGARSTGRTSSLTMRWGPPGKPPPPTADDLCRPNLGHSLATRPGHD